MLKLVTKNSEKTLSSKSKNLCQMIIFFNCQRMKLLTIYRSAEDWKRSPSFKSICSTYEIPKV